MPRASTSLLLARQPRAQARAINMATDSRFDDDDDDGDDDEEEEEEGR